MDRNRDTLTWRGERVGDQIVGIVEGYDRHGNRVEFVVDAPLLRINLVEQHDWIVQLDNAQVALDQYLKIGVPADSAWEVVRVQMPPPKSWTTAWRQMSASVGELVADDGDQLLEGGHDRLRQPDD